MATDIDVVSGSGSAGRDWSQVWLGSKQFGECMDELEELKQDASATPPTEYDDQFASVASGNCSRESVCTVMAGRGVCSKEVLSTRL
jgi:hypothetical protein